MADTIIGKGIIIDGEISGSAPVIIEGMVKGRITVQAAVTVAEGAVVNADVNTPLVDVQGELTGNIQASERVQISTSGRMVGDIRSPRILIADGAGFKGHIDMDVE